MPAKFCESCGTSVMETMRICPQCGHRMFSQLPIKNPPTNLTSPVNLQSVTNQHGSLLNDPYAGFWERFAAYLIDATLTSLAGFFMGFVIGLFIHFAGGNPAGSSSQSMLFIAGFVGLVIYYSAMESSNKRATLGKQFMGLQVTDLAYNQISGATGVGRYFGRLVSILIVGIGYFIQPFNAKRQALHDMMAGTVVVRTGKGKTGAEIFVISLVTFCVYAILLVILRAINHSTY